MSRIALGTPGTVYVARCESHAAGILKIGATTDDPHMRAKQLTAATSAPTPFYILYSREVPDVNKAEAAMHAAFAGRRVNENREFFKVSLWEAATTLDILCGDLLSRMEPLTPFANLFATFDQDGPPELSAEEQRECRELERRLRA